MLLTMLSLIIPILPASEGHRPMLKRFLLSFLLLWSCLVTTARADSAGLPSVALYYGANPPLAELRAFDVAVVDPDHVTDPRRFRHRNSSLFAYVSLGEVHPSRPWFRDIPPRWLSGSNRAWGSRIVDQSSPEWTDFVLERIIAPLWDAGYRGFFLDTLDSYQRVSRDADARARQEAGLARTIRAIKSRWPEARLIANRGFEILPDIRDQVWMVAAESLYRGWDAGARRYVEVSEPDRQWLRNQLLAVRDRLGKPVLVIDYVPASQRALARETARRLREEGFIPWVATPELDQLGVGAVEVLPRKVLVIHNPAESPDLHYADAQRFLGMPLAWLGLVPEYLPVNGPLPASPLTGRYAGIISWINSDEAPAAATYAAWLERQVEAGVPLAVFSRFGVATDSPLLARLGLQTFDADRSSLLSLTAQHDITRFELPVTPRAGELYPVRLKGPGRPLLTMASSAGQIYHPAALTDWGGYALGPYTVGQLPGEDNGERWYLNPLEFLARALHLDPEVPRPDFTTESGRRLLMIHIDGDGFASAAERPDAPPSGQVLRDDILRRYPLPTTVSVIEGEVGKAGLHPAKSPRLEAIARDIFALPWVEPASHSYSHPFHWGKAEANLDNGESYHLAIPGYQYQVHREVAGSLDYINRELAPAGKPARVFLWTGNCVATPDALAAAVQAGVLNMNGGDTLITRSRNSWTRISGPGVPRGADLYQVFAPNQNENVYTNLWTGPFYGFRRVIETFELTEKPYRFKPVNIYYHTYAASKTASLKALHEVYDWALAQPLHPVYASDYIRKVLDFNDFVVARDHDGFLLRGNGHLRTVRLPESGPGPDFTASRGVAGLAPGPKARYVHLDGDEAWLALSPRPAPLPYLESGNGRIDRVTRDREGGLTLDIRGYRPLRLTFANAGTCQARWNGRPLPARRHGNRLTIETEHHALAALQILCPR